MEDVELSRLSDSTAWLNAFCNFTPLEFNDVVLLDAGDQPAHSSGLPPPPPTPSHPFPVIVIDGASDPDLSIQLDHLQAPVLNHFCKDLATMVWNSMFHEPVARQPTSAMCWKFITQACHRQVSFNPAWQPEEGTSYFVSLFICKLIIPALSICDKHETRIHGTQNRTQ